MGARRRHGPLNQALLDVQMKLRAEGDAIQNCTKAYLASRAAVRLCFLFGPLFFLLFLSVGARQRTHWV